MTIALLDRPAPASADPYCVAPSDDGTRREFLVGGLALTVGLAACGEDGADRPADRSPAAFPRVVDHAGGSTRIPARPTRVFAVRSMSEMDTVLALGVVPAAYGSFPGRALHPWQVRAGARESQAMNATGGVNLEQLVAEGIDLVVATAVRLEALGEEIADYQRIAPVVAVPELAFAEQLRIAAESLGIDGARARARAAELERLLDAFRPPTRPASIVVFTSYEPGTVLVFTATSNASRLLRRVGLPALPDLGRPEPGGQVTTLSVERLGDLDADVVLGLDFDGEGGALDAIEAEPVFARLWAVREGSYHRLAVSEATAINHPSVLSVPVALDVLRRVLIS